MKLIADEGYLYIHKTDRTSKGRTIYCPDGAENEFEMLPEDEANALYEAAINAQAEDEESTDEELVEAARILLGGGSDE